MSKFRPFISFHFGSKGGDPTFQFISFHELESSWAVSSSFLSGKHKMSLELARDPETSTSSTSSSPSEFCSHHGTPLPSGSESDMVTLLIFRKYQNPVTGRSPVPGPRSPFPGPRSRSPVPKKRDHLGPGFLEQCKIETNRDRGIWGVRRWPVPVHRAPVRSRCPVYTWNFLIEILSGLSWIDKTRVLSIMEMCLLWIDEAKAVKTYIWVSV
jgi:hypothetical protein